MKSLKVVLGLDLAQTSGRLKPGDKHRSVLRLAHDWVRHICRNSPSARSLVPNVTIQPYNESDRITQDSFFTVVLPDDFHLYTFVPCSALESSISTFVVILNGRDTLSSQSALIQEALPISTGAPAGSPFHFYAPEGQLVDTVPLLRAGLHEMPIQYTQAGCSVYQFCVKPPSHHLVLFDDLTVAAALSKFRSLSKDDHRPDEWEVLTESGATVQVAVDATPIKVACPQRKFILSQQRCDCVRIIVRFLGGVDVYWITVGHTKVSEFLNAPKFPFRGRKTTCARIMLRYEQRYLKDDFDLTELPHGTCLIADVVPQPFSVEFQSGAFRIDPQREAELLRTQFKPEDRLPIYRIKELIAVLCEIRTSFDLVFDGQVLDDNSLLANLSNPDGKKLVVAPRQTQPAPAGPPLVVTEEPEVLPIFGDLQVTLPPADSPPPPRPVASSSAPQSGAVVPTTRITFALRNHPDVCLEFETTKTVSDAKVRLGARYGVDPNDVLLLHQGRGLGDRLLLSRLRLAPGGKVNLFIKDASEAVLVTAESLRVPLSLSEVHRLRNLQKGEDTEITVALGSQASEIKKVVAKEYQVPSPFQIALLNGLIVIDEIAVLADLSPPPPFIGFTINSPSVGEFVRLLQLSQQGKLEDEQQFVVAEAAMLRELTDEEQEKVDQVRGTKISLSLAVLIFLQSNRNYDAIGANAELLAR